MATNGSALIVPPPAPPATNAVANTADIRQVRAPVVVPAGWAWVGWALGALVLALLAAWLWRRWRRRQAAPAPVIVIPPHVRARDRLRAALEWLGQPERFCVLVSDTIRVYLEERFELRAPERTTEEFLEELQRSPLLSLSQKRSLADFLMRCDLVKFARYEPGEPELRELYDAAVRLVEETEPSLAPPLEPAGPGAAAPAAPAAP
jgi:hypothetical protein